MTKRREIRINAKPYDVEIRRFEGGFEWTFRCPIKNRDGTESYGRSKLIRLTFDRWWLSYLANNLKSVIDEEQEELDRLKELSGFQ
jgi:hypothetical protein